jgi:hypothetical protein
MQPSFSPWLSVVDCVGGDGGGKQKILAVENMRTRIRTFGPGYKPSTSLPQPKTE